MSIVAPSKPRYRSKAFNVGDLERDETVFSTEQRAREKARRAKENADARRVVRASLSTDDADLVERMLGIEVTS